MQASSHVCEQLSASLNAAADAMDAASRDRLDAAVGAPLLPFAQQYTQYVQSALAQHANALALESTDVVENAREIENSINAIYDEANLVRLYTSCVLTP